MIMSEQLANRIRLEMASLEGWTTPERGIEMADLILKWPDDKSLVCVEVGVFGGKSLIPQAMACQQKGFGVVYGIDPWKVEPALEGENEANREWWAKNVDLHQIHRGTMEAIWRNGLDHHAIIIRSCSQDCYSLFREIHILNIDGNHSEIASTRDVDLFLPRVVSGGYIWMDDTDWASTQKAIARVKLDCDVVKDDSHYKLFRKR